MSGEQGGKRDWAAKFAPPPPPPLKDKGAAVPAASLAGAPAPAEPAQPAEDPVVRRLSAAPDLPAQPAPATPVVRAAAKAPTRAADQASVTPTRAEKAQASDLLAELGNSGLDARLVGVRRGSTGTSFDVQVGDADAVEKVVLLADNLALALGAAQVRVSRREDPTTVRLDLLRAAGESERGRQKAVWVPAALRDAVSVEAERSEETITEFFLGAFNRQYELLDTFFPRRLASPGPMPQNKSRRRRGIETAVQMWLYLNPEQQEILDDAEERSGAGSRSALVTRILARDLGLSDDGTRPASR